MPRLIFSRKIAELYRAYVFINVNIMSRDTNHDTRSNIRMRSHRLMISLDYDKSGLMKTSCGKKWYFFPRVIQICTKSGNFAQLYFPHFTTFRHQTNFKMLALAVLKEWRRSKFGQLCKFSIGMVGANTPQNKIVPARPCKQTQNILEVTFPSHVYFRVLSSTI